MIDLTFFTTNTTKIAHARHFLGKYGARVLSFRERTYHASYEEPRLLDRFELLRSSYESALDKARSAGTLSSKAFFFLEDTSVEIEALSSEGNEVPGLDIKYWMRENDFQTVDQLLKDAGNNRRVIVRSHIVLHIPEFYKKKWNVQEPYLIFKGEQEGTIISNEIEIKSNVVYPWLDNLTFNKWFCPGKTKSPISKMDIELAEKYDFRGKSLINMAEFLQSKGVFYKIPQQLSLNFDNRKCLVICGYTCAGKTTAGQFLAENYGYLHVEASDFIHLAYYKRHGFENEIPISSFALAALAEKPQIAAEEILKYLRRSDASAWVLTGFRALEELTWFRREAASLGIQFTTLFIDADNEIRFKRMGLRGRKGDAETRSKFKVRDSEQSEMGLDAIKNATEVQLVTNESSIEEFLTVVSSYTHLPNEHMSTLSSELPRPIVMPNSEILLEDAILITLLDCWATPETRKYFTTTDIAHRTGAVFPNATQKQKDNVSRHFNQTFSPYYEMMTETENGPRKYRLSNTGYGEAIARYRKNAALSGR
ncbi:non-canonical purine NTP pyrophosphatase [Pseudovibrio sp. SCP19]|uniref:non-canonical purine NTP pyrophosphatase n=1 Tax=Pseudovibrio sp. SCP19 TaxID=3141374 RepID=UPI00333D3C1A